MFHLDGNAERLAATVKNVPFLRYSLSRRVNPVMSSDPGMLVSTWVEVDRYNGLGD
jgi:hypothetical protein